MQVLKDNVARINALTKARLVEVDVGRDSQKHDELQQIIDQVSVLVKRRFLFNFFFFFFLLEQHIHHTRE